MSTNTEQRWLKVAEVADRLRVSKMTVYRLIAAGELRSARVGRSYRLSEHDVDAYLRRGSA
jgi:excisionase family DNA binding protein